MAETTQPRNWPSPRGPWPEVTDLSRLFDHGAWWCANRPGHPDPEDGYPEADGHTPWDECRSIAGSFAGVRAGLTGPPLEVEVYVAAPFRFGRLPAEVTDVPANPRVVFECYSDGGTEASELRFSLPLGEPCCWPGDWNTSLTRSATPPLPRPRQHSVTGCGHLKRSTATSRSHPRSCPPEWALLAMTTVWETPGAYWAAAGAREAREAREHNDPMSAPWPIVTVDDWSIAGLENQGQHSHDWLKHADRGRTWLFKPARPERDRSLGEDVTEKLGSEFARLIGVPAAPVELATRRGVRGALVEDVRLPDWELQAGQALIPEVVPNYDPGDREGRGHNVETIRAALERFAAPAAQAFRASFERSTRLPGTSYSMP